MPGASDRQLELCRKNLEQIVLAVKLFSKQRGRRPTSLSELTEGDSPHLKSVPVCPASGSDTYSAGYRLTPESENTRETEFTLCCKGENHKAAGVPADFPKFDPKVGFVSDPAKQP